MPIVKINGYSDSVTPVGVSQLGTVVFDNVFFPSGNWTNDEGKTQTYPDGKLDAVTLSVNRMKMIQKSYVSGRDGSIKEYITLDDYIIDLQAIVAPESFSLLDFSQIGLSNIVPGSAFAAGAVGFTVPDEPSELMAALSLLEQVPKAVNINCKLLNNYYDINSVVIEEMNVSKSTADTYSIKMRLISDKNNDLKDFG